MAPTPKELTSALEQVWRSLAGLGDELPAPDWERSTECPGWSVRDQYAHIIGTESALLGEQGPPPLAAPHAKNRMGEVNEGWVDAWRGHTGPEVLAAFRVVTDRRLAALRALTPTEWDQTTTTPVGPGTYALFMEIRVFDCWVHEQDVRRAVERPGDLEGRAAEIATGRINGAFGFVVGKRVAPPDGTSVVVDLAPPLSGRFAVEMVGGRARPVTPPAVPTMRISTDGETWLRLSTGRATVASTTGSVTLSGDEVLGRAVLEQLAITP